MLQNVSGLVSAIAELDSSHRQALCDALAGAASDGFGSRDGLGSNSTAVHGVITVKASRSKHLLERLRSDCEQCVASGERPVSVHLISDSDAAEDVASLLQGSAPATARLVIVSQDKLHTFRDFPWPYVSLLVGATALSPLRCGIGWP